MAQSIQRAVSDGTLEFLDISINYLDRTEIAVYFDAALTTQWEWSGSTDKRIVFTDSAVPIGVEVLVKRTTDISKLRHAFSEGAAFTPKALDEDLTQVLHIAQEANEANMSGEFYNDIDMHNHRIKNVGTALDDTDALTLGQYKADAQGAYAASLRAEAHATSARQSANFAALSAASASGSATKAANASRLTVGTVDTLAPGTQATASITGAVGAQKLSLGIPQGPVGATGPTGPAGPTGPVGPTGPAGAGSGNVQRNSTVEPGALAVFDGPTGTYIRPSEDYGIMKLSNGVPQPAEPGIDYAQPNGTVRYAIGLSGGAKINGVTFTGESDITVTDPSKQPAAPALSAIVVLEQAGHPGLLRYLGSGSWAMDNSMYLTANQTITISGDATGSGGTSITLELSNVGTAGTYATVTTDAKGRVIAGAATLPVASGGTGATTAASAFGNLKQVATDNETGVVMLLDGQGPLIPNYAACLTAYGLKSNQIQKGPDYFVSSTLTIPLAVALAGGTLAVSRWKRITLSLHDARLYGAGYAYLRLNGAVGGYVGAGVQVANTSALLARTEGHPLFYANDGAHVFGGTVTILYLGYDNEVGKHVYSIFSVLAGAVLTTSQSILKLTNTLSSVELYSNAPGGASTGFREGTAALIWE